MLVDFIFYFIFRYLYKEAAILHHHDYTVAQNMDLELRDFTLTSQFII